MIETPARVIRVESDYAWVEPKPHKPCGLCDPESGCRTLAIARLFSRSGQSFRVLNALGAQQGDWVTVAVPERGVLYAACLMYMLPLCGLFFGALLGGIWSDIWSAIGGGIGLLATYGSIRCLPKICFKRAFPHIVARIDINILNTERVCRSKNS